MDKLKTKVLFISLIILALLSVGAVAAGSVGDDVITNVSADDSVDDVVAAVGTDDSVDDLTAAAEDSVDDEVINANQEDFDLSKETTDVEQLGANDVDDTDSNGPLTAGESGNFTKLQELVNGTPDGGILELDMNYTLTSDEKPIIVNKTITIDGKGHTLDAKNLNAIMSCLKPVILKNIISI